MGDRGHDGLLDSIWLRWVSVRWLNDAPTIAANAVVNMTPTNENAISQPIVVRDVLTASIYDDPDANSVPGLAIIGMTGSGFWQYSPDGVNWTVFSSVSDTAALVLSDTTRLRYIPNGKNGETATLRYRAWNVTTPSADLARASKTPASLAVRAISR